jgi:predicted GIY-YIG superfamily endonuclease
MKGRVYQITNEDETIRYVGSTTATLNRRFSQHKSAYKLWLAGKTNCCVIFHSFKEHGIDAFAIELLEEIEITDKCELLQLENQYISDLDCINKNSAFTGLTREEYNKQYREDNKEKIREKIYCDCGGHYSRSTKARHFRSKKHIEYLS